MSPIPASSPAASRLRPQHTHLRWSKEWMLREDLPWPPPTQLRDRPNILAAPARRSLHGLMPQRPSGREPAAAAQAAEVVKGPPNTFLPGPQLRTDIQPEPAVRQSRFTAAATRNAGKCSSPARPRPLDSANQLQDPVCITQLRACSLGDKAEREGDGPQYRLGGRE